MRTQFLPQISKKFILPLAVSAATIVGTQSLKAQEPQKDTFEIAKKEMVTNNSKKESNDKSYAFWGIAFLLSMGVLGLGQSVLKAIDSHKSNH